MRDNIRACVSVFLWTQYNDAPFNTRREKFWRRLARAWG